MCLIVFKGLNIAGYKFIYMLSIGPKPGPIFSSNDQCLDDDSGDESK